MTSFHSLCFITKIRGFCNTCLQFLSYFSLTIFIQTTVIILTLKMLFSMSSVTSMPLDTALITCFSYYKIHQQHFIQSSLAHSIYLFLLYSIVLVLPYINMNPLWVYTCSPSWTPLPPPSPNHPSGSSQCTSPEHTVSCIDPGLAINFTYDIIF